MSLEVRTLEASDYSGWLRATRLGFLRSATVSDEEIELRRPYTDLARAQGAFDDGRCVATFRSMPRDVTVPGGAVLPSSAITQVTVSATHRRRGVASRMMANELAATAERGEPLAILIAAEFPIYGRFGFGAAAGVTEWHVDTARAGLRPPADDEDGRVELVDPADVFKSGPELHERVRLQAPGSINRNDRWWELFTGKVQVPGGDPWKEPIFAFYRDSAGRIDGLAAYTVDDKWRGMYPESPLEVKQLIAATPAAERALWRFLLSIDWVTTVRTGFRAHDDVMPLLLGDRRAARIDNSSDFLWLRFIDVPRALAARTYAAPGAVVLDVVDPYGYAAGRFRVEAAPDGTATAEAAPSVAPDLTLTAADLATLYLGDESAVRLATVGQATESHPGAAARVDALFRTSRKPWAIDGF
ncbi:GNAT family N-acetyltransferase [Streptomyces sp. MI02-7b]|uniref:GNAT family N-acetyltransferase n=1 Tax=Streptomyces sp. MI02-7b TaxID=462941 RepID=UPI0029A13030|nr:GNAT family N-acetyltransferase [Streptomyces sp. MI02-7b]MDX3076498.1 GNAT family N-acetyltransferase [Streptomyces sp. MI02-7b]